MGSLARGLLNRPGIVPAAEAPSSASGQHKVLESPASAM
jgi:hypothetical protein